MSEHFVTYNHFVVESYFPDGHAIIKLLETIRERCPMHPSRRRIFAALLDRSLRRLGDRFRSPFTMTASLPTEHDFDPFQGDLDAQCAWRNFGGLSLEKACEKFEENPECYQEDFMFMGGKAFAFYYPAIDQFLRKSRCIPEEHRGDRQSWILPQCIKNQFGANASRCVLDLKESVLELCRFMIENIQIFEQDWHDATEIERQWRDLDQFLRKTA